MVRHADSVRLAKAGDFSWERLWPRAFAGSARVGRWLGERTKSSRLKPLPQRKASIVGVVEQLRRRRVVTARHHGRGHRSGRGAVARRRQAGARRFGLFDRSDGRRVGKGCVRPCRTRWAACPKKKKKK